MNLNDTPEQADFRQRARAWIRANAPWNEVRTMRNLRHGGQPVSEARWVELARQWQKKKYDAGWACLVWPREHGGGGLGPRENVIFQEEEGYFAELFGPFMIGQGFIAPTLMAYASGPQKSDLLPKLASGDQIWCQLFSEPGAGSDLAGVRTRAERTETGDWRVNGQKVWTSGAQYSEWGLAVLRTDPTVAKHKGLTVFMVPMDTPGITIQPIRQLGGGCHFNAVYFDDVTLPDSWRVGPVNDGWRVALTTLMNERMTLGASIGIGFDEIFELAGRADDRGRRPIDDRQVRLRLAEWYAIDRALHRGVYRSLEALEAGGSPGPELSVGKLVGAVATQDIAAFGLDLLGERGRAASDVGTDPWTMHTMFAFGAVHRVEGGTDEILRNIIAERVLGLPPEQRADTGPFKDIPTAPAGGAQ
jgi:alkylation response protein AidB-like acyl-CoA dehydrogenase